MVALWGTKSPFLHPNQMEGLEKVLLPGPKLLGTGQETPSAGGCHFEAEHQLLFLSISYLHSPSPRGTGEGTWLQGKLPRERDPDNGVWKHAIGKSEGAVG